MLSSPEFEQLGFDLGNEAGTPEPASEPAPAQPTAPVIDFSKQKRRTHKIPLGEYPAHTYSKRSQYGRLAESIRQKRIEQQQTENVQRPFPGMGLGETPATHVHLGNGIYVTNSPDHYEKNGRLVETGHRYFDAWDSNTASDNDYEEHLHVGTLNLTPTGEVHMDIHPDYQKQGIGKALLGIADQWAKERVRLRPIPPRSLTENSEALINNMLHKGMMP